MTRLQKLNEAAAVVRGSRVSLSSRMDQIKLSTVTRNTFLHRYLDAMEALMALEDSIRVRIQFEMNKEGAK